jgi:hypothetical protein
MVRGAPDHVRKFTVRVSLRASSSFRRTGPFRAIGSSPDRRWVQEGFASGSVIAKLSSGIGIAGRLPGRSPRFAEGEGDCGS